MHRILGYCLLIVLALGGSCKKSLEIEGAGEPSLPLPGCRIVKTYYKQRTVGLDRAGYTPVSAEVIILDDSRKVEVSLTMTTTYAYDDWNRIKEIKMVSPYNFYYHYRYRYDDRQIISSVEYVSSNPNNVPNYIKTDTIRLNDRGLPVELDDRGRSIYTYNADGQLLSTDPDRPDTRTYVDGNLKQKIVNVTWQNENGQWLPTDYQLRRYEYDLSRSSLPVINQFQATGSRNLLLKEMWEMKRSSELPEGPVYRKTYTYTYDKQGHVKRHIAHGKSLYVGWLIEDDPYGVGVTDYEYECN